MPYRMNQQPTKRELRYGPWVRREGNVCPNCASRRIDPVDRLDAHWSYSVYAEARWHCSDCGTAFANCHRTVRVVRTRVAPWWAVWRRRWRKEVEYMDD